MEYWDIYDVNKKKTGRTMLRNDWHMQPGEYHLTVLALVRDMAGRTLITRRQLDKEWAPSCGKSGRRRASYSTPARAG